MPRSLRSKSWFLVLLPVAFLAFSPIGSGQTPPPSPTAEFVAQVERHFSAWDGNKDGRLSSEEIDELVSDPKIKGKTAAAVAALKRADRNKKITLPPLTREYFRTYAKLKGPEKLRVPDFAGMYASSLRRIEKTNRELFVTELPHLDTMHQGRLGDCYFLAPVGATVARNPETIKRMFHKLSDGAVEVRFGSGRRIRVQPITDSELGLTSSTNGDGVWLNILEKAFGESRNERLPEDKQKNSTTDLIAQGGSTRPVIELLTGHQARGINIRTRATKDLVPTPEEQQAKLPILRQALQTAFRDKRLVCCSTPESTKVPGINGKHAYAVLGYSSSKDEIHVWNPHGNSHKPKGEAGLVNGYPTQLGRFTIPLKEFVQVYGSVSFETGEPLKPATTARGGKSE